MPPAEADEDAGKSRSDWGPVTLLCHFHSALQLVSTQALRGYWRSKEDLYRYFYQAKQMLLPRYKLCTTGKEERGSLRTLLSLSAWPVGLTRRHIDFLKAVIAERKRLLAMADVVQFHVPADPEVRFPLAPVNV